jgi:diaminopimelate decarboxylase
VRTPSPDRPLELPFREEDGELWVDGVRLSEIAARHGTPVYVTAEGRVRDNARRFRRAFEAVWPRFEPLFAVKSNSNPAILSIVRSEGFGADCASPGEVALARSAGIPRESIVATVPYPSSRDLDLLAREGVGLTLDDPTLLPRVLDRYRPDRLAFRLNPEFRRGGAEKLALGGRESKFGARLSAVPAAWRSAREGGVPNLGLHAMVGSNLLSVAPFRRGAAFLGRAAGTVERRAGSPADFLDLGGGFGVPYRPQESPLALEAAASAIADALRSSGVGRNPRDSAPSLVAEPGRYVVADSTVLLAEVTHVKPGPGGLRFVGLDAGMQTLLRPALYGAYHAVHEVAGARSAGRRRRTVFCGPVCEPKDVLGPPRVAPPFASGDLVAIGNAGAYGYVMSSEYCGRPRPAEVLVRGSDATVIRRAETVEELGRGTERGAELPAR